MCIPLLWFYAEHKRRCCTIYFLLLLILYDSIFIWMCILFIWLLAENQILCSDPMQIIKEVVSFFIWIYIFCHDFMQSIKIVALFIWKYIPLLLFYTEHQRSCCNIYFNLLHHILECISLCCDSLWIAPNTMFHHLLECIFLFVIVYEEHKRRCSITNVIITYRYVHLSQILSYFGRFKYVI